MPPQSDFGVLAYAAQVKAAIDATIELGGENYVFWGGREGYACLQNTDTRREQAFRCLWKAGIMAVRWLWGYVHIEPKPMEPMKHQYGSMLKR